MQTKRNLSQSQNPGPEETEPVRGTREAFPKDPTLQLRPANQFPASSPHLFYKVRSSLLWGSTPNHFHPIGMGICSDRLLKT